MKIIQSNFPGNQLNGIFQGLHPAEEGNFDPPFQDMSLPYTDVRVREAINRALDRETIKNTLFSGRVTTSPQIGYYSTFPVGTRAGLMISKRTTVMTRRGQGVAD